MKASIFAIGAAAIGLLLGSPQLVMCQDSNTGSKLEVRLDYSGTGAVDEKHKIYVALWDSPDFVKSDAEPPFATQSASSKNSVVTFDNVKKTPIYVSTAYDPSGHWDAQSPPPDGSSLGR